MKMCRLILMAALSASLFISAKGQSTVKIQGGLNFANVSVTDNGRVNKANQYTSFQLGLVGDFHLGSILYIQPGVLYTGKGAKTETGTENSTNFYRATTNPTYIEVPLNLVLKAPIGGGNHIFFGAGPYLAVGVGGKNEVVRRAFGVETTSKYDIKFSNDDPTTLNNEEGAGFGILKRFDYGLNGTAGIEGKSLSLGVNYGLGMAKLQSGTNSSANNNNKNRVFSIVLGIKI